jgi:hypothetical protein
MVKCRKRWKDAGGVPRSHGGGYSHGWCETSMMYEKMVVVQVERRRYGRGYYNLKWGRVRCNCKFCAT